MKWWICLTALVLALTTSAAAADLPAELERAAPEAAEDLTGGDLSGGTGFAQGVGNILDRLADQVGDVVRERTRGAAAVLLVVVLCGVVEGFAQGTGGKGAAFLPMAGALSITLASAGSLDSLMGLGSRTIGELADFSQALLPTLAAATAASGAVTTATVQQVSTVFFVDLLLRLIRQLLLPLVYLYIGLLTAAACLPENRLGAIAEALKKLVTWILTTALLVFTIYLSIVRIISGSADSATVKVAKAAISGVVPVVGGIIADASETVLAGAGMLKNTIGVFGMLAILAACAYPFLQLGVQYLLYKLTAYLAEYEGRLASPHPILCANAALDAIAGHYQHIAESQNTKVFWRLELPERLPIDEVDLCMMLGNLMENALHAVCALPIDAREVTVISSMISGAMLGLSVENSYVGDIVFGRNGLPITRKRGHGIGLPSVAATVKRYNGTLSVTAKDGVFGVNILLSL